MGVWGVEGGGSSTLQHFVSNAIPPQIPPPSTGTCPWQIFHRSSSMSVRQGWCMHRHQLHTHSISTPRRRRGLTEVLALGSIPHLSLPPITSLFSDHRVHLRRLPPPPPRGEGAALPAEGPQHRQAGGQGTAAGGGAGEVTGVGMRERGVCVCVCVTVHDFP